jgi:hypothetical protein
MPEQLVRAPIHEVRLSAGRTIHGQIGILAAVGFFVHPVMYKLPALRTSEDDVSHCHTIDESNQA